MYMDGKHDYAKVPTNSLRIAIPMARNEPAIGLQITCPACRIGKKKDYDVPAAETRLRDDVAGRTHPRLFEAPLVWRVSNARAQRWGAGRGSALTAFLKPVTFLALAPI